MIYFFLNRGLGGHMAAAATLYARATATPVVLVYSSPSRTAAPFRETGRLAKRFVHRLEHVLFYRGVGISFVRDVNAFAFVKRLAPADHGIICGFNQIFTEGTIGAFGSLVNFHPSILPFYRGPMPSYWCIKNGERMSGFTLHVVTPRIDSGPIMYQEAIEIGPIRDPDELDRKIGAAAARRLPAYLNHVLRGDPWAIQRVDGEDVYRVPIPYAPYAGGRD